MAEGSRKAFGEYTGQRVNPVPEGFLSAYAQIGKNIQETGKDIGEGIGGVIKMYQENAAKHETADATMQAASTQLPTIFSYFDKQIAGTDAKVVKESTENPDSTNPQVLAYRALVRSKDDVTKKVSKWTDLNANSKTATIGQIAQYAKAAQDDLEIESKRAAALLAQRNSDRDFELKTDVANRQQRDSDIKNRPANSADILSRAVSTKPYGIVTSDPYALEGTMDDRDFQRYLDEAPSVTVDPQFENQYRVNIQDLNAAISVAFASGDEDKVQALKAQKADLESQYNEIVATSVDYSSGVNSAIEGYKALVSDPKAAEEVVAGIDAEIKQKTDRGGKIPAVVQKDIDRLTEQRNELTKAIKDAKANGGQVIVSGNHIKEGMARSLNSATAGAVWASTARANGIPVTPEAQKAVESIAYYDGHTTESGHDVTIDKKTGALVLTENEIWTKWWKSDPKNLPPAERIEFERKAEELNQLKLAKNQGTFGTVDLEGKTIPQMVVVDTFKGTGTIYVSGKVALPIKDIAKLREDINLSNSHLSELNGLKSIIVKKDADGKIIYKKDSNGNNLTDPNGYPIAEYVDFKKLSDADKRYFTARVNTYLRSVAKGLGVLSKQDWEWLNTQAGAFGNQFVEQWSLADASVFQKLANKWINEVFMTADVLVPKLDSQSDATTRDLRTRLSMVPAEGGGYLTVTSGAARNNEGTPYSGKNLIQWYDRATMAGTSNDELTFENEYKTVDQQMIVAFLGYENPNPVVSKEQFQTALDRWTAVLKSKGATPAQIEAIKNEKFPLRLRRE